MDHSFETIKFVSRKDLDAYYDGDIKEMTYLQVNSTPDDNNEPVSDTPPAAVGVEVTPLVTSVEVTPPAIDVSVTPPSNMNQVDEVKSIRSTDLVNSLQDVSLTLANGSIDAPVDRKKRTHSISLQVTGSERIGSVRKHSVSSGDVQLTRRRTITSKEKLSLQDENK